jgi:aspartyl-tRNA(Asn)/glutamyl-tRNA(Gln) amidotransferase subunit A
MNELLRFSLIELAEAIRSRSVSPVELMEVVLSRIEQGNPQLNAIVQMRDREALLADAKVSEERVVRGHMGPLEGIPLGVKDLEDAAGLINSEGSLLFADRVSERDSTQVARLRKAGAIVLGKTNTPEFGFTAITKNLLYGTTRSPWNLDVTPGGSSGGSAAALAGCLLPLVTASDGGGSIRIPASFTGAFGLKPSFGRVPRGPSQQWTYSGISSCGPIVRTVEDAALFMDQVVGSSHDDPNSLPHPGISYLESLRGPALKGLRLAFSPDFGYAVVQSDVARAVEENVKVFEKLGHKVDCIEHGPPLVGADWNLVSAFENASRLHPYFPGHEGKIARFYLEKIKDVWNMTPERWGEAARKRNQVNEWCEALFSQYDLLVTPTVPYDPPPAKGPFPEVTEGRKQVPVAVAVFTIPFNQSGHPACSLRVGMSEAGLPIGMQIVGPRYREDLLLHAARAFEAERPWHPHWPEFW